jgi:hypothetical protein
MKHEPTLEERIKKLHEEIDRVVAVYVDSRAAQVPGVPRGNVEAIILARANGCVCEEYRLVQAKLEAERKLADVQVSTG